MNFMYLITQTCTTELVQTGPPEKNARWNKAVQGTRGHAKTYLKIEDFMSLIFKIKIKQPWLRLWVPSEIHSPIPDSDR